MNKSVNKNAAGPETELGSVKKSVVADREAKKVDVPENVAVGQEAQVDEAEEEDKGSITGLD